MVTLHEQMGCRYQMVVIMAISSINKWMVWNSLLIYISHTDVRPVAKHSGAASRCFHDGIYSDS